MKSEIKGSDLPWTFRYVRKSDNAMLVNTNGIETTSVILDSDKSSVDTGVFIPNVYRVNPYLIYGEQRIMNRISFTDKAVDSGLYDATATLSGDLGPFLANRAKFLPSMSSNIDNYPSRVLQRAYGKLGDGKVGMGENLGEIRETLQFLRSPFKTLRDFLASSNYRRLGLWNTIMHYSNSGKWVERGGRQISGVRAAKVAADSWLELRYGLMPLVYTVQDLIELVNAAMGRANSNVIRTVRASTKVKRPIVFLANPYFGAQLGNTELFCDATGEDELTFRACVQYRMVGVPSLAQQLKLTPRFLPELAWELTRASFVVDWWFDVGAWLGTLRLTPEITVLGNTIGIKIDRQVSINVRSGVAGIYGAAKTPRGKFVAYRKTSYERRINQDLPLLPLFKSEVNSINHAVDALALILQPILGKLRRKP